MSFDLLYTSAPSGLKPGQHGFCTVAATAGLPRPLWDRLEALSAYRHDDGGSPVVWAHWLVQVGGRDVSVLSRVCDAGQDYTGRTNFFAHHLALDHDDRASAGPAWMLSRGGLLQSAWDGQVATLPPRSALPTGTAAAGVCRQWAQAAGDAGWGGVLAEMAVRHPRRPVAIIVPPGFDPLPLLAEAIALLPPEKRWDATFCTYFTGLPTNTTCSWRCCIAGTPAAAEAVRHAAGSLVIDLSRPQQLGRAPDGPWAEFARTGQGSPATAAPTSAGRAVFTRTRSPEAPLEPVPESDDDGPIPLAPPALPRSRGTAARVTDVRLRPADDHGPVAPDWMAPRRQAVRRALIAGAAAALLLVGAGTWLMVASRQKSADPETLQLPPPPPADAETTQPTSRPALPTVPDVDPLVSATPPDGSSAVDIPQIAPPPVGVPVQPERVDPTPPPVAVVPPPPLPRFVLPAAPDPRLGVSRGILDTVQTIAIPEDAAAAARVARGFRLALPQGARTFSSRHPDLAGELRIEPSARGGMKDVVTWRDASSPAVSLEVGTFSLEIGRTPAIEVTWKSSTFTRRPEVTALARTLIQNGHAELTDAGGSPKQVLLFPALDPLLVDLLATEAAVTQQVPPTAAPLIQPNLVDGWQMQWTQGIAAGEASVLAFERPAAGDVPAQRVELRVSPGWRQVQSNFGEQREAARAAAADAAARFAAAEQEVLRVQEAGKNRLIPLQGEVNEAAAQLRLPDSELSNRGTTRLLARMRHDNAKAALAATKGPVDMEIKQAMEARTKADATAKAAMAAAAAYDRLNDVRIPLALPNNTPAGLIRLIAAP